MKYQLWVFESDPLRWTPCFEGTVQEIVAHYSAHHVGQIWRVKRPERICP